MRFILAVWEMCRCAEVVWKGIISKWVEFFSVISGI